MLAYAYFADSRPNSLPETQVVAPDQPIPPPMKVSLASSRDSLITHIGPKQSAVPKPD